MSKQLVVERHPFTNHFGQVDHYTGGGVASFLTWERLQIILKENGICRPNEQINRIAVDAEGIQIYYETVE